MHQFGNINTSVSYLYDGVWQLRNTRLLGLLLWSSRGRHDSPSDDTSRCLHANDLRGRCGRLGSPRCGASDRWDCALGRHHLEFAAWQFYQLLTCRQRNVQVAVGTFRKLNTCSSQFIKQTCTFYIYIATRVELRPTDRFCKLKENHQFSKNYEM